MKLKSRPEDFQVEEIPLVEPGSDGRFVFYRLSKQGIGTLEAIDSVRRQFDVSASRVAHGGLKDKHASTIQYLTILDGPERPLRQPNLELEPIGRLSHPYGPTYFRGNRFRIALRNMTTRQAEQAAQALADAARDGIPNYFDDQRFGSMSAAKEFSARAWLEGNYERAFWLAIVEPNPLDRPETRASKDILREHWGNWAEAKAKLDRSHERGLVTYLVDHPDDFRGVYARIRRDLRSLYFSAFQSHLWNLVLADVIEQTTRPDQRMLYDFKSAKLPIPRGLESEQAERLATMSIPLPSARSAIPEGVVGLATVAVLERLNLEPKQLRVKHLKDVFLSKGERPAMYRLADAKHGIHADELYRDRRKLIVSFELPRGGYATMLVKRITLPTPKNSSTRQADNGR